MWSPISPPTCCGSGSSLSRPRRASPAISPRVRSRCGQWSVGTFSSSCSMHGKWAACCGLGFWTERQMLRSELIDDYRPTLLSQILREHFAGGNPDAIAFVEAGAQYLTLEPGDVLLRQGASGDDVYFVLSGRLRAETGPTTILGEIGRGEPVGELA